jgi:hypothetical protein
VKSLIAFCWMMLVFNVAIGVFFSMQVIDRAQVMVDSPALCSAFDQPVQDGRCLLSGKAEANMDRTWSVNIEGKEPVTISRKDQLALRYDPADWHMRGGMLGVWALLIAGVVLACGWPAFELWRAFAPKRAKLVDR